MTEDEFWALIDKTRSEGDPDEHGEAIEAELSERSGDDIVDFERIMTGLMASSYSWELWGAAYIINGGCSDDGFDYFRGWLITQGQEVFKRALTNPDSLADLPDLEEEVECESILYAPAKAYETATGDEIPEVVTSIPDLDEGWDFDDDDEMMQRYPKLFAKFYGD